MILIPVFVFYLDLNYSLHCSLDFLDNLAMPKMSLYDHHLSLSLSVLLLASVSVNSSPINFQNGCHLYDAIVSTWCKLVANNYQ